MSKEAKVAVPPEKRLQRALRRLVRAEVNASWKGGGDPDDIPAIERELKEAKTALKKTIEEVFNG